jgi:hypothetical protein
MAKSRGNRFLFGAALAMMLIALFLASAEAVTRLRGYKPWSPVKLNVKVVPGGKLYRKDPALGYTNIPGKFRIYLPSGYSFTATNDADGLRITHPPAETRGAAKKPEIWIFGCSFTYGWSLDDDRTYPWALQTMLPAYEVRNFGVNGYGTLQALMQFRKALEKRGKPDIVVLAYASFHEERNTFLRQRRKYMVPYNSLGPIEQPYARLGRDDRLEIHSEPASFTEAPLMRRSAFVNFLETYYDTKIETRRERSNLVTRMLIMEMTRECERRGIKFVLAGILDTVSTRLIVHDFGRAGGAAFDISVNLDAPGNNNLPHDYHPSAKAQRIYAEKLFAGMVGKKIVAGETGGMRPPSK